ncbi:hypothetical protein OC712_02280 [Candidatus Phytoplasma citri]|uniref:Alpha/beta hydrolase n=2 Tax=Candidatus Phytoplasma citri TaxID=180978 RepID=A0ABU8ZS13_9MOLU
MITQFQEYLINYEFNYPKPIFLLHGQQNKIIPFEDSQELFKLIKKS